MHQKRQKLYNQSFKKFRKRASLLSFFIKLTSYINHCFGRVFGWYQVSFRSTFSFYQILPFQNSHIVFSLFLRNGENSFPNFYYYRSLKLVIIIMVIADVAQAQVSRMLLMNLFLKAKLTIKKDHHQLREGSYLSLNSRLQDGQQKQPWYQIQQILTNQQTKPSVTFSSNLLWRTVWFPIAQRSRMALIVKMMKNQNELNILDMK